MAGNVYKMTDTMFGMVVSMTCLMLNKSIEDALDIDNAVQ